MHKIDINVSICRYWPLRDMWSAHREQGWYWRFYYDDAPGAGIRIKGRNRELLPGSYYLIPPGVEFITWQKSVPRQFYMHFEASQPFGQVAGEFYEFPMTGEAQPLIERIEPELRAGSEFITPKGGMLCAALCALALARIPEHDLRSESENPIVARAKFRLKEALNTDLSINELAVEAGICPDSLIRLFKTHIGTTPYQYLTSLRVEKAAGLLENTSIPIDEIAGLVGFKDRFHFSRIFKSRTNAPPAAYRKMRQR